MTKYMNKNYMKSLLPETFEDNELDEPHNSLQRSSTSQRPYGLERQWFL